MTKKEYLLKVLDKVKGYWPKEAQIRAYLLANDDQKYEEYLYTTFVSAVDKTLLVQSENKKQTLTQHLDGIKQQEFLSHQADEEDLKKLDQLLITL